MLLFHNIIVLSIFTLAPYKYKLLIDDTRNALAFNKIAPFKLLNNTTKILIQSMLRIGRN
jgi:hypothetical protein